MSTARCVVFAAAIALASGTVYAQKVNRIIGKSNTYQRAEDACALSNGDVALAGGRSEFTVDSFIQRAIVTRTGPDGVPIWQLAIGEPGSYNDEAFGVRQLPGGNLVAALHSGQTDQGLCAIGLNSAGTVLWKRRYPGAQSYPGSGMEIERTDSKDLAVIANSYNATGVSSGQLLRIDASDGTPTLDFMYSIDPIIGYLYSFSDVAFGPGTDYFVTGSISLYNVLTGEFDNELLIARIDRSGNAVWAKAFANSVFEHPSDISGNSIELTLSGNVAVVGRAANPIEEFGPASAIHIVVRPTDGLLLATGAVTNVQPASASLDRLSTGELVASGTRTFGDGEGAAQMWLINPIDMTTYWRAEYVNGRTFGADAIEHLTPSQGLVLAGLGQDFLTGIGPSDQLFIRTDVTGDDACAANIWIPDPIKPLVTATSVTLIRTTITGSSEYLAVSSLEVPATALPCTPANPCPCDLNGDGFVDDADFVIFVNAYNILDCADPFMPAGCPADFNGDGFVDDADFVIFVPAYNELVCP
ncbi:MAG: hypothetical protein ACREJD_16490 [Phycisphaerales bacterium]